jgi:hypothetical protein
MLWRNEIMCARLAAVSMTALAFLSTPCLGQITGTITVERYTVNGVETLNFLGPGDMLRIGAGSTVSVGAGDPATHFYQFTAFTLGGGADIIAHTNDDVTVQPDDTGLLSDVLGYQAGQEPYYGTYIEVHYFDTTLLMTVSLDSTWEVFFTD